MTMDALAVSSRLPDPVVLMHGGVYLRRLRARSSRWRFIKAWCGLNLDILTCAPWTLAKSASDCDCMLNDIAPS